MGKKYGRGSGQKFVLLYNWFTDCPAWRDLKPGPRALYLELKKRYKGGNNGEIFLSHRDAAELLSVGRDTVGSYYASLLDHGFIEVTKGHCLGPAGAGQAARYALTELPLESAPATRAFMRWQKQKPRRKTRHSLAGNSGHSSREIQHLPNQKPENPTALEPYPPASMSENPAIYPSNHFPLENSAWTEGELAGARQQQKIEKVKLQ